MEQTVTGRVDLLAETGELRILLNPDAANIFMGGDGASALLLMLPEHADPADGADGQETIRLNASRGVVRAGANGAEGQIRLYTANVSGDEARKPNKATIELHGGNGNIRAGGPGRDGDLTLFDQDTPLEDAGNPNVAAIRLNADDAHLRAGGNGRAGGISLIPANETGTLNSDNASIRLDAGVASYLAGGNGTTGDIGLVVSSAEGDIGTDDADIFLNAGGARVRIGGVRSPGDLLIYDTGSPDLDDDSAAAIHLRGSDGDIRFGNADIAEEFDAADGDLAPGTIVCIDDETRVRPCKQDRDTSVVGVVAGAGRYKPGLVLDHQGRAGRVPVTMIGKAVCRVDATSAPIRVGDLLTTSCTPGHARRVPTDEAAAGAIIGKALGSLPDGTGEIPVLINLQ